jgi:hypothetical protein
MIASFKKKEIGNSIRAPLNKNSIGTRVNAGQRSRKYVPKILLNMKLATTDNSTSVHFGMNHLCVYV